MQPTRLFQFPTSINKFPKFGGVSKSLGAVNSPSDFNDLLQTCSFHSQFVFFFSQDRYSLLSRWKQCGSTIFHVGNLGVRKNIINLDE